MFFPGTQSIYLYQPRNFSKPNINFDQLNQASSHSSNITYDAIFLMPIFKVADKFFAKSTLHSPTFSCSEDPPPNQLSTSRGIQKHSDPREGQAHQQDFPVLIHLLPEPSFFLGRVNSVLKGVNLHVLTFPPPPL